MYPLTNSANLSITSPLIADLLVRVMTPPTYQKVYKPLKQTGVDIHHILEF